MSVLDKDHAAAILGAIEYLQASDKPAARRHRVALKKIMAQSDVRGL